MHKLLFLAMAMLAPASAFAAEACATPAGGFPGTLQETMYGAVGIAVVAALGWLARQLGGKVEADADKTRAEADGMREYTIGQLRAAALKLYPELAATALRSVEEEFAAAKLRGLTVTSEAKMADALTLFAELCATHGLPRLPSKEAQTWLNAQLNETPGMGASGHTGKPKA